MSDVVASAARTPTPQDKHALEQAQQALEQAGFNTELSPFAVTVYRTADSNPLATVMPWTIDNSTSPLDGEVIGWMSLPEESTGIQRLEGQQIRQFRGHCELSGLVVALTRYSEARDSRQRAAESTFEGCLRRFLFQGELQHAPGQPWDVEETLRKGKSGVTKDPTLSRIQKKLEGPAGFKVLNVAIEARHAGARLPALFAFAMMLKFGNRQARSWTGQMLDKIALNEGDISDFLRFRHALGGYGREVRHAVDVCRRNWIRGEGGV